MVKFEATVARIFRRIFVCRRCKQKVRTDMGRILAGKVKCRTCQGRAFRPIKSKKS
ncbi:MAG TPA: hypothetical protein VJJ79_01415 [Candidatus Nanoarchaeia archaeon]|nr:hypothetical protein [Candidatus Nanoarchaeia archaeon]